MLTYRYRGHSMSDPAKYRTREEVEKVRTEHDPIEQVRRRLLERKWASEDELKKIDAKVRDAVNEAAEFATNDPEPDPSELYTDVCDEAHVDLGNHRGGRGVIGASRAGSSAR